MMQSGIAPRSGNKRMSAGGETDSDPNTAKSIARWRKSRVILIAQHQRSDNRERWSAES